MKTVREIGFFFNIPVVECYYGDITDIQSFINYVKNLKNLEGFVITFTNGHRVKLKADEYVQLHRAKDSISIEKNVWAIIIDEKVDDILPLLSQEDRENLLDFSTKLNSAIINKANELHNSVNTWVNTYGTDQKKFAVEFVNNPKYNIPPQDRGLLFKIKAGHDPFNVVRDYIKSQCSSATTLNSVRKMVDGLKWNPGYDLESS